MATSKKKCKCPECQKEIGNCAHRGPTIGALMKHLRGVILENGKGGHNKNKVEAKQLAEKAFDECC